MKKLILGLIFSLTLVCSLLAHDIIELKGAATGKDYTITIPNENDPADSKPTISGPGFYGEAKEEHFEHAGGYSIIYTYVDEEGFTHQIICNEVPGLGYAYLKNSNFVEVIYQEPIYFLPSYK